MSLKLNLGVSKFFLKMGNSSGKEVYEFGDFRLDADHLMLYRGDEELALAPKAVETLVALVARRGEIMSKDELLEAVWPDAIVEESNLFVYLSVLRKTLGTKEDGAPWLETRKRRGYRFNGDVRLVATQNGTRETLEVEPTPLRLVPTTNVSAVAPTTPDVAPAPPRPWTNSAVLAIAVLATVVIAAAFAYQYTGAGPIKSIAVLPFVNEARDPELDYISDGLTESFIASLSKVPGLLVQSRSAVSRYKGKDTDPRAIGDELGVSLVVYGWITKHGENVTLRVELVDTQNGARLWEGSDTQKVAYLSALEGKVVGNLITELRPDSAGVAEEIVASRHSPTNDAYNLYLQGRFYSLRLTPLDIRKGIGYLRQAVEKDPSYAAAYASLARAHLILGLAGEAQPSEFIDAKEAAQRATELDSTLAEGYSALASVAFFYDRNFAEAENLYKRALELEPNNSTARQQYADFLNKIGRHDEGRGEIARAMEIDPFSPFINAFYAISLSDNDDALRQIRSAVDRSPNIYLVHMFAAEIYRRKGMYDEAIEELRSAKELSPDQTLSDVMLIRALKQAGKSGEARKVFEEMLRDSTTRFIPPVHLAAGYYHFGEKGRALEQLEKGYNMHDPKIVFLNESVLNEWSDYRDDPQFQDLMRRVGFLQ